MDNYQYLNTIKTQKEYILEYVTQIDKLLEASLSHEALANDRICKQCNNKFWALWRCKDCDIGVSMCWGCIRSSHKANPLHWIEHWNGNFFWPAELWEAGTHLLVPHHQGAAFCNTLRAQEQFLEMMEKKKDNAKQDCMNLTSGTSAPEEMQSSAQAASYGMEYDDDTLMSQSHIHEDSNTEFFQCIDKLWEQSDDQSNINDIQDEEEMENEIDEDESDMPISNQYLHTKISADMTSAPVTSTLALDSSIVRPTFSAIWTYVHVVHTSGIHHIALVNCVCCGNENLPSDLIAAQLLPASFKRIRTVFTAQLLDLYHPCNLELKSSAYQFYHLLQCLTNPMALAEVVNIYWEFHQMSQLWRWMKQLKWDRYCNDNKNISEVSPGQLTVFCLACPQPGVNLPNNWKDDPAQHVLPF